MELLQVKADNLEYIYKVIVAADDLNAKVEENLTEASTKVSLPGFRPGKVPLNLIRKRYGKELRQEAVEIMVQSSLQRIVTDEKIKPAMKPQVLSLNAEIYDDDALDLIFTLEVVGLPDIKIIEPSTISFERFMADVSDDEIANFLMELAAQYPNLETDTKKRAAENGDVCVIDFEGFLGDKAFPGGKGEGHSLEIGSNQFIPGFEEQLIGKKAGEEFDIMVTFPEEYQAEDLAGKESRFHINLHEIKVKTPRDVNDELATMLGMENLDMLRDVIRNRMVNDNENEAREIDKRQLLDYLEDALSFSVPTRLVEQDFANLWQQVLQAKEKGELDADDMEKDDDTLQEQYKAISERRVRLGLYLNQAGNVMNVNVEDYEVEMHIDEMTRQYPPEQAKQYKDFILNNPDALNETKMPLYENKVIDTILAYLTDEHVLLPRDDFLAKRDSIFKILDGKYDAPNAKKSMNKKEAKKEASSEKSTAKKATKKSTAKKDATKKDVKKSTGKKAAKKTNSKKSDAT